MRKKEIEKNILIYYNDEKYLDYYLKIKRKEFQTVKILKDDQRSYVALISIDGQKMIYKEPKEKNNRIWQRFLSIFRGGESSREFINSEKIQEFGFLGAEPILAVEQYKKKMCVFSFFLMDYIESHHAAIEEADMVKKELDKIHSKGFLHGDSQLSNFMINENEVYLIDCKLTKNHWSFLGKMWEFLYLEKSCYRSLDSKYSETFIYKLLKKADRMIDNFNYKRKKIKKRLKGE